MVADQYKKEIIVLRLIYISQSDSFHIRQLNNVIITKTMVNLPKAHVALAGFSYPAFWFTKTFKKMYFGFLTFFFLLANFLSMSIHDEDYSRNASCAQHWIPTFLLHARNEKTHGILQWSQVSIHKRLFIIGDIYIVVIFIIYLPFN